MLRKLNYFVCAVFVLCGCVFAAIKPGHLRCEYRVDPLGIDVVNPRLSWIVTSDERCQVQSAYRVIVALTIESLRADKGDLWDSGKVASDQTSHVVYEGRGLSSSVRCYWKVKVWDGEDKASGWSSPAMWSMGLLGPADWKGVWIGLDSEIKPPEDKKNNHVYRPSPYLRKEFTAGKSIKCATVYATSLGMYELRINGERVGKDFLTPGWTDYNKRVHYQSYDVTGLVKVGRGNAIGAILSDGWYAGNISVLGQMMYGWQLRLMAQLVLDYTDGSQEVIATDPSWKASTGAILEADMFAGETYDSRLEMPGWDRADFDDKGWKKVDVTEKVKAKIEAYSSSPTRVFQEIKPVSITEPKKGNFVLNMGTNFAGWVRLKVMGKAGDKVQLRFAERLNPDGTIYTANLRSARTTDTYICKGGVEEVWEPRFTFHGFQYVEVTGYPGKVTKDSITGVEITANAEVVGGFDCSSEMANQLYRNICQTQRANFIEIPTDCPQRDERMGWTGDAQIYVRTATYNCDVAALFTKWMVDVVDAQYDHGGFPIMAPKPHEGVSPAWSDAGVICPETIYTVYGDKRIIEKHYEAMGRWIDYCVKNSKDLIRPADGFGDWLSIKADTPKEVLSTAYFAKSTKLMARMAEVIGKDADAAKYNRLFERIKAAFIKAFVNDEGRIKGDTQTVYVLAIAFDLLDDAKAAKAIDYLVADIEKRDWHLSTGFIGTKDLMGALTKAGRTDVAYRLFNNDTFPSWGFSIAQGATSIWERWNGWTPEEGFFDPSMNSFAHYSFGAVAEWMFKVIGGIDTDGSGYKRIIFKPRTGGGIDHADVTYKSINGRIGSRWRLDQNGFRLSIVVPANTSAMVYVPAKSLKDVTESGEALGKAKGVKVLGMQGDTAVLEVGSGQYRFVSKGVKGIKAAE